jgi:hypothetical protein
MKERKSGLRNESSKTKRTGLFQRITAAFPLPLIIIYKKVSSTFLPNLPLVIVELCFYFYFLCLLWSSAETIMGYSDFVLSMDGPSQPPLPDLNLPPEPLPDLNVPPAPAPAPEQQPNPLPLPLSRLARLEEEIRHQGRRLLYYKKQLRRWERELERSHWNEARSRAKKAVFEMYIEILKSQN